MALPFTEKQLSSVRAPGSYFLAGDVGGTNSNFCLFNEHNEMVLLFTAHSQEIVDYAQFVEALIEYCAQKYALSISDALFGVAGIISAERDYVKPTNLSVSLDAHRIKQKTGLQRLLFCNDFELVALGLERIAPNDIVSALPGNARPAAHRGFVGAGTGLGKSIAYWAPTAQTYVPLASEGGHADFPIETAEELELIHFIQQELPPHAAVSWEDVLSGNGIKRIYRFLATRKQYPETSITTEIARNNLQPDYISRYAQSDPQSADTWHWYAKFYARCARNFALESLSLGGLYIAGGIASKNIHIFSSDTFKREWYKPGKHEKYIVDIPLFVIRDYYINLYGCITFRELFDKGFM